MFAVASLSYACPTARNHFEDERTAGKAVLHFPAEQGGRDA